MKRIILAALAGMLASGTSPAFAKPNWIGQPSVNFPAYVKSFVFPSGRQINQSSSLCWGNWCVSFGAEAPVAYYFPAERSGLRTLNIHKLKCKNPVAGTKQCTFNFVERPAQGQLRCWLQIKATNLTTRIDCPIVHFQ